MILRFGALALILYGLGFFLFSVTLATPAPAEARTDAIVAITGGEGRIEQGVAMLGPP